jgi:hypothetical protein
MLLPRVAASLLLRARPPGRGAEGLELASCFPRSHAPSSHQKLRQKSSGARPRRPDAPQESCYYRTNERGRRGPRG